MIYMKNCKNTIFERGKRTKMTNFALNNPQNVTRPHSGNNCSGSRVFFGKKILLQKRGKSMRQMQIDSLLQQFYWKT